MCERVLGFIKTDHLDGLFDVTSEERMKLQ